MKFDFDQQYIKEWESLGFYYTFDKKQNCWIFTGSKKGLLNFCNVLDEYVKNPVHKDISEHEHYGPDSYLKLITWNYPIIKESGIYGRLEDFKKLSDFLKYVLWSNKRKEIVIDKEFSEKNECYILLKIMNKNFDPATLYSKQ